MAIKIKSNINQISPRPLAQDPGSAHLDVGARADRQQHDRQERVEVEERGHAAFSFFLSSDNALSLFSFASQTQKKLEKTSSLSTPPPQRKT